MLNRNTNRTFILVAGCAASALVMTGCRGVPGSGMLGLRGEPSAEALAGNGPTVTYPAPPSAKATPEAIASVAGGTASSGPAIAITPQVPSTTQVAGLDISPGYATQATNMSAAEANGVRSSGATQPASYDTAASEAPKPSGYAFGAKAFTPKDEPTASTTTTEPPTSSYALGSNSGIASTSAPLAPPSTANNTFAPPPMGDASQAPSTGSAGGFTLPTDSPAFSAITPPSPGPASPGPADPAPAVTVPEVPGVPAVPVSPVAETTAVASISPPLPEDQGPAAADAPSFSTASAATGYTAPTNTSVLPPSFDAADASGNGYMPGSTGTSSGYPTLDAAPTTSGSYYR